MDGWMDCEIHVGQPKDFHSYLIRSRSVREIGPYPYLRNASIHNPNLGLIVELAETRK